MSELLAKVRSAFIAEGPQVRPRVETAEPPRVAGHVGMILGRGAGLAPAAALALLLGRDGGARAALVCRWDGEGGAARLGGVPGGAAARRLAARLAARDVGVRCSGRLVVADLPADPEEARSMAARSLAVADAAGVPAVVALSGARPSALDPLLAEREVVVVVVEPGCGALAEVAAAGAAALGPPVACVEHRPRFAERSLARSGVAATGSLRRALEPARRATA